MDIGYCILGDGVLGDGCDSAPPPAPPQPEIEGSCSVFPPVGLGPLKHSNDDNAVEADLKQMFIDLYYDFIRAGERELNVYGSPHLGSFDLIERFVKEDGLSLLRKEDEDAMRYLFRAWKARNPKRGFHFLRTYLQLLWPNAWTCEQMWQEKGYAYPTRLAPSSGLPPDPSATHYLTSRVVVSVVDPDESGANLASVAPAIRGVLGAKFVLFLSMLRQFANTGAASLYCINGMTAGEFILWEGQLKQLPYGNSLYANNGASMGSLLIADGEAILPP